MANLFPLVDADLLVYRIAWTTLGDSADVAYWRTDKMVEGIFKALDAKNGRFFLTSTDQCNFRLKIDPQYKANRKDTEKPVHYDAIRSYFIEQYSAVLALEEEADDLLGIHQRDDTVIVSIDKDLDQIPGWHYHFVKKELYEVSALQGLRSLYRSMLIGDTSDNIRGVYGIGKVGAGTIIDHLTSEYEMYLAVLAEYEREDSVGGAKRLHKNAKLLKIRRKEGQVWRKPKAPKRELPQETIVSATPMELRS